MNSAFVTGGTKERGVVAEVDAGENREEDCERQALKHITAVIERCSLFYFSLLNFLYNRCLCFLVLYCLCAGTAPGSNEVCLLIYEPL